MEIKQIAIENIDRYFLATSLSSDKVDTHMEQLALAPITGFCRTIMSEYPSLFFSHLHSDDSALSIPEMIKKLSFVGNEQELCLIKGELKALRLERTTINSDDDSNMEFIDSKGAYYNLQQKQEGRIDSLYFQKCDRAPLGPNDVEFEVEVASLHFKDVMKSLGLLSDRVRANTFFGDEIGIEGTGRVTAVGSDVKKLKAGDRVYSIFPGFMQSHIVTSQEYVFKLSEKISFEDGAHIY
ncbi:MAG: hypothetical protein GY853_06945 [PVC group bacterium]|nr:hypothetical protein [PVC group bacterium]